MKKVYVTEGGFYDEVGHFCGSGIIGVDSKAKSAIAYIVGLGYKRIGKYKGPGRDVRIYKRPDSYDGIRITVIEMC